jgi:2-amino-4-hydroxy-6-hydroxymethyldihydropteridine diphosphokinase
MNQVTVAHVGLGSNLGDRAAAIEGAIGALDRCDGVRVASRSDLFESEPEGPPGQGPYLNAAVGLRCSLSPRALLETLCDLEAAAGRTRDREGVWGPRTLDLDLLLFGSLVIDEPGLVVPHPRMHLRLFVLDPLCQIAPDAVHPLLGCTVESLRSRLVLRSGAGRPRRWAPTVR